jgi:hypothetical protein
MLSLLATIPILLQLHAACPDTLIQHCLQIAVAQLGQLLKGVVYRLGLSNADGCPLNLVSKKVTLCPVPSTNRCGKDSSNLHLLHFQAGTFDRTVHTAPAF